MDSRLRCGRRRTLIELAMDLTLAAGEIAEIAEAEIAPYVGPPLPEQIAGLIEARGARASLF